MLPTLKLFGQLGCPEHHPPSSTCKRSPCLFSHNLNSPTHLPVVSPASKAPQPAQGVPQPSHPDSKAVVSRAVSSAPPPPAARPPQHLRNSVTPSPSRSNAAATPSRPSGAPQIFVKGAVKLHTPVSVRQKLLESIYNQFLVLYADLSDGPKLASRDALAQESECFVATAAGTYRNSIISVLGRMKKRPIAARADDLDLVTGTMSVWEQRKAEREKLASGYGVLDATKTERYLLTREQMLQLDYIVDVPAGSGGEAPLAHGERHPCARCGIEFIVSEIDLPEDAEECAHHWGRLATERANGPLHELLNTVRFSPRLIGAKQRVFSCCRLPLGSAPCAKGRHVFAESSPEALHTRAAFTRTSAPGLGGPRVPLAALDCEMIYTTSGQSLARVTVVAPSARQDSTRKLQCDTILDEWIRFLPGSRVLDLLTRFSGIKDEDVQTKAKLDIGGAQRAIALAGITAETILVGHGLENDLKALRLVHDRCIDTVALFPHPQGPPLRMSLRNLAATHLKKFVQTADPSIGHSSAEDATTALELVRFKMISDAK